MTISEEPPLFKKVLIANRGEIACRIISTLRKMGITSVAVYSEADAGSLFVEEADEAYLIGPASAAESYLNIDKIIEVAKAHNVEAIHPGYGFLAENPEFVRRLEAEKITFIGPSATCIQKLGDKIEAKKVAQKVGVPILSGDLEPATTPKQAETQALKLGFPVLIKAVAGGGGKGMRRVNEISELKDAVERAMGEAKSAFGDSRIFIEKFLENPRHIEIQVLGDKHGNILTLGERECSLQRRYQKLIEEAPSPFVDEKLRQKLYDAAKSLAQEVGYYSLGTVEFLLDDKKNFYFLEINPRIQVEHPVTEQITGIDLVEQMVRVAAGEKLILTQKDIKLDGWSMEARICAEDPRKGFVPSIGRVRLLDFPSSAPHCHSRAGGTPGNILAKRHNKDNTDTSRSHTLDPRLRGDDIRIDTGITEGAEISPYYDSMIAKVITHGRTREEARLQLIKALNAFSIHGVTHNIDFLTAMANHTEFAKGDFSTHFIEKNFGAQFVPQLPSGTVLDLLMRFVVVKTALLYQVTDITLLAEDNAKTFTADFSEEHHVDIAVKGQTAVTLTLQDQPRYGHATISNGADHLTFSYTRHGFHWTLRSMGTEIDIAAVPAHMAGLLRHIPQKKEDDHSHLVLSPMPGLLLSLNVHEGDVVSAGTPLAIVEAMKMENVIRAHREGKIIKLHVKPGESLSAEQPIIEFEHQEVG